MHISPNSVISIFEHIDEKLPVELAVFVKNPYGVYNSVNAEGAKLVGARPKEVIGCTDFDYFESSSAKLMMERDRQIAKRLMPRLYDSIARNSFGWRHFFNLKMPVQTESGIHIYGISADLTDQARHQKLELRHFIQSLFPNLERSVVQAERDIRM